uniref:Nucleic acid-binding protein n=1 Tax=Panagrolaimus sp. JU765 TaxID=591449 RepID=A0AC34RQ21_9BILA
MATAAKKARIQNLLKLSRYETMKGANDSERSWYFLIRKQTIIEPKEVTYQAKDETKTSTVMNIVVEDVTGQSFQIAIWDKQAESFWDKIPKEEDETKFPFVVMIQNVAIKKVKTNSKNWKPKTTIEDETVTINKYGKIEVVQDFPIPEPAKIPTLKLHDLAGIGLALQKQEIIKFTGITLAILTSGNKKDDVWIYNASDGRNQPNTIGTWCTLQN